MRVDWARGRRDRHDACVPGRCALGSNRHDEARQEYRDTITMAQTVEPEFQKG